MWIFLVVATALLVWFLVERSRRRSNPVSGGIDRTISLPHTDEVELYSNSFSHCSRKARLVLAELGIQTRHHHIDLIETGWYQTLSPDYLSINPAGLVPTLVHKGHPVYESDDILAYAQSIAGSGVPQLVPTNPVLQNRMNEWLEFCSISSEDALANTKSSAGSCIPGLTLPIFVTSIRYIPLHKILVGFLYHFDKKRPAMFSMAKLLGLGRMMTLKPIRQMIDNSRKHMLRHLATINTELIAHGGVWILGEEYSLADVSIGCLLLRLEETGWLEQFSQTSDIEAVLAYYERIKRRPAWNEAITAHAHPIISKAEQDLSVAAASDQAMCELIYGSIVKS